MPRVPRLVGVKAAPFDPLHAREIRRALAGKYLGPEWAGRQTSFRRAIRRSLESRRSARRLAQAFAERDEPSEPES